MLTVAIISNVLVWKHSARYLQAQYIYKGLYKVVDSGLKEDWSQVV